MRQRVRSASSPPAALEDRRRRWGGRRSWRRDRPPLPLHGRRRRISRGRRRDRDDVAQALPEERKWLARRTIDDETTSPGGRLTTSACPPARPPSPALEHFPRTNTMETLRPCHLPLSSSLLCSALLSLYVYFHHNDRKAPACHGRRHPLQLPPRPSITIRGRDGRTNPSIAGITRSPMKGIGMPAKSRKESKAIGNPSMLPLRASWLREMFGGGDDSDVEQKEGNKS